MIHWYLYFLLCLSIFNGFLNSINGVRSEVLFTTLRADERRDINHKRLFAMFEVSICA
jgi:hypothetical protein